MPFQNFSTLKLYHLNEVIESICILFAKTMTADIYSENVRGMAKCKAAIVAIALLLFIVVLCGTEKATQYSQHV